MGYFLAEGDLPLITQLGRYGAAGVILAIFLTFGWIVYKRERDRADANEKEIARLNQLIQDKYVPALEETKKALSESATALAVARDRSRRS